MKSSRPKPVCLAPAVTVRILTYVPLGVIAILIFSSPTDGGDSVAPTLGNIFSEAQSHASVSTTGLATHVRARAVEIDWAGLSDLSKSGGGRLRLNVFNDTVLAATVSGSTVHPNGYSLRGRIDGRPDGQFNLVVVGDAIAGIVRDGAGSSYEIRPRADGTHLVRQLDASTYPPCAVNRESTMRLQDALQNRVEGGAIGEIVGSTAGAGHSSDDGSVLDLLVLYSDVTRQAAGGTNAIRAEIYLAVDVANDAYAASGIATILRLVHVDELAYDEVTGLKGFEDHLIRLWRRGDGDLDEAHDLRDLYGADLVSLIVEDSAGPSLGTSTCGIGYVMQEMSADFKSAALSVVNRECSANNWTLAHEIGHNQGCAHNREDATIAGLFSYSFGYWFTGNTRGWRTIMAYASGDLWERVGHFSNPNVIYDGASTGAPIGAIDEAHNAATIFASRVTVARFRTTRYWVDFDWSGVMDGLFESPFNGLLEGIGAVPEGGMVVVKSGEFNAPLLLTKPLKINTWGGSTIIGQSSP